MQFSTPTPWRLVQQEARQYLQQKPLWKMVHSVISDKAHPAVPLDHAEATMSATESERVKAFAARSRRRILLKKSRRTWKIRQKEHDLRYITMSIDITDELQLYIRLKFDDSKINLKISLSRLIRHRTRTNKNFNVGASSTNRPHMMW